MIYLTRRYGFSASHRLHSPRLSEEGNAHVYGKCNNPGGHGHNYGLEITLRGKPDPRTGMVVNLVKLDGVVQQEILDRFDHTYLNADEECFRDKVPTAENLCIEIFNRLHACFPEAMLERVRLEETSKNSFVYRGEEREVP